MPLNCTPLAVCGAAIGTSSVNDIKGGLVFIKTEFEVGRTGSIEISCAPFDVEDSVGRAARDRSEYATVRVISSQISLIGKNNSVQTIVRQRTRRAKVRLIADKL